MEVVLTDRKKDSEGGAGGRNPSNRVNPLPVEVGN